jgi:fructose-1,6-bisphosphatase/inositol monophosphatase family enzyme
VFFVSSDITTFLGCAKATIKELVPRVLSASVSEPDAVQTKRDGSLVTLVDKLVESELVAACSAAFSEAPVLAEEGAIDLSASTTLTAASVYSQFMESPRQIIIDPIDGTRNFVDRKQEYCIAAALSRRVTGGIWPVAGVVAIPATGLLYWCDDHEVYVEEIATGHSSTVRAIESHDGRVSINSRDRTWLASQGISLTVPWVSSGSSVYDLIGTVLGRLQGSVIGSQRLWDLMAPLAFASRLGFVLSDLMSGAEITALSVSDLSSDVAARPWGLARKMALAQPNVRPSEWLSQQR